MNIVALTGRMTADPNVRYSASGNPWASFSIAVDGKTTSFPTCKAFADIAVTIEKLGAKGRLVSITGHIQTGSYNSKDGHKVYTTDVIVDRIEFMDKKHEIEPDEIDQANVQPNPIEGFQQLGIDDDIPF